MKSFITISIVLLLTLTFTIAPSQCSITLESCLKTCQQNTNNPNSDQCINACVHATTARAQALIKPQPQQQYYGSPSQQQYQNQPMIPSNSIPTEYLITGFAIFVVFLFYKQMQKNHQVELSQVKLQNQLQTQEKLNENKFEHINTSQQQLTQVVNEHRTGIQSLEINQSSLKTQTKQLQIDQQASKIEFNRALEFQNNLNREFDSKISAQGEGLNNLKIEFKQHRKEYNNFVARQTSFNQAISSQVGKNTANISNVLQWKGEWDKKSIEN